MLPINNCVLLASVLLVTSAQEWTKLNCPAPRSPTHGMSFIFDDGQRVQFHCHPGFKMIGKSLAECRRNQWNVSPPKCIPINANQDSSATTDNTASPYPRSVFNWQNGQAEENEQTMSVAYGAGSNRLPIINGLWGYPSNRNNRVLSIVPDPYYGHAVKPKELLEQEMKIAALRHQMEREVMNSRHIEPKQEEPTLPPYYSPYKINSDGYLVGIGGVNSHPVYYLGASADHKVDEYYKNTRIGPELAELRRKQIEEARNIQMNAANNRQRNQFQNTLTYGTKDIPVWKGRQTPGKYWSEETVYKPARVEMSKYAEQNRFFDHNPPNTALFPRLKLTQRITVRSTEHPFYEYTEATRAATSRNKSQVSNIVTQTSRNTETTRMPFTSFTHETIVANIPTPPVLTKQASLPLTRTELKKVEHSPVKNEMISAETKNQLSIVDAPTNKSNNDDFEWPPEALWFKTPTTRKTKVVTTRPIRRLTTKRSSKGNKSRGKRPNKKKDQKQKAEKPQVAHFSHGRVKNTDPKGNRRNKS